MLAVMVMVMSRVFVVTVAVMVVARVVRVR
jgi:hypothetical protein